MVVYAGVEGGGTSWRVAIAEGHPTNITESKVKKHREAVLFRLAPIDQPGHVHLDQLECARDAPKGVKPPLQESRLHHPVVFIVFHPPSFIPCADERAIEALALCTTCLYRPTAVVCCFPLFFPELSHLPRLPAAAARDQGLA